MRILLGNPSLSLLIVAFGVLTVAEWGYVTALAIDAFRRHGPIAVGLVGLRLFFAAISSLLVVPLVEHRSGRGLLTAVAVIRAAVLAASAALAAAGASIALLLALVAVDAFVSALYRPAQSALLPSLARTPTELAASVAGMSTVKTVSQALGAVAAGWLLTVTTPTTVFAAAAVMFLGVALATLRLPDRQIAVRSAAAAGGIRRTVRETVGVIREHHVSGIVVVSGLRTFVRGMWTAIAVIVSLRLLHAGSAGVGLLMLAAGVGSLTAVPLVSLLIRRARLGTPTAVALVACGAPLAVVAGVPLLSVAMVVVVAWGVGMAVADVAASALLYRLLDTPLLPRVVGAIESAKLGLEGLGGFLAPALVSSIGVRFALVAAALPLPVVVAAGWESLQRADASAGERHRLLTVLHGVPCLQPLDIAGLEAVAARAVAVSVPDGTDVVRQGDCGDHFYVVVDGTADVLVDGFLVGCVGRGGSFGERALLRDVRRMATVRARGPMELLALTQEDFLGAVTNGVGLDSAPGGDRSWSAERGDTRRERVKLLSGVSLLSHLESSALGELADLSVVDRWAPGAAIVHRGDEGDRFYILLDGHAVVTVDDEAVAELHPGDQFGEIAILHDVPRQADVITVGEAITLSLHRDAFLPAVRTRMVLG